MIRRRLKRSLLQKLHNAGTTCQSVWLPNELSQLAPREIAQTQNGGLR